MARILVGFAFQRGVSSASALAGESLPRSLGTEVCASTSDPG
uniref:Uncharacterized protein n=1 Tax=Phytophthora fragariae TaxID=53985 RepID=A0A6A3D9G6_9STRA|nr:hypothetical protein PF009_g32854 [Phytophthora fragariae]